MSSPDSRPAAAHPAQPPGPKTRGRFARRIGRWRNLRLPIKLGLVTLVPVVVLLAFGVVLVDGQLAQASQYARANRITELSVSVRTAISALQDEREQVATPAAGKPMDMAGGSSGTAAPAAAATARHEVDLAVADARAAVADDSAAGDIDPVARSAWAAADRQLGALRSLRAAGRAAKPDRSGQVTGYTQVIDSLFAFDRVLGTSLADAGLTRQALSVEDLFAAREEVRYQQAVVLAGIGARTMSVADVTSLHGSEARLASRISDFRAVADRAVAGDYDRSVRPTALGRQSELLGEAIDQSGGMTGEVMPGMAITVSASSWDAVNRAVTAGLDTVTGHLADSLLADAAALRSGARTAAGTAIVVLVVAFVLTVLLVVVISRQLLRSIGVLRRTARDVAARRLPDAVERIRAGETVDATVAPVGVPTTDEIGQLARAFDAVHGEALRLAVEQANMRANYSELFVNLSRRSQSLVQRQLRLIEQLERDEEDPDQLAALFKLDHLATRMRRNNENLMVLSGGELARGGNQQVSLADLLRAAVSEIEHYQRVVVQPPPDAHVVGYAAGDLIRLLAELLDNATAYSAPDTPVTVASHRTRRKAVVIDIVDHGIGMSDEDLVRANEQLSHPAGVEGRISRRMGLFVISRLAHQHDVRVRLHGGQDIPGLRVTITVPAELVIGGSDSLPPAGDGLGGPNGSGPLPKRTAGATRGPNGPWQSARGTLETSVTATTSAAATSAAGAGPDPGSGALTVTIPQLPSAVSSGVGLFAPLSDADGQPAQEPEGPAAEDAAAAEHTQVTPIFDTLSAWFEESPATTENAAENTAEATEAVAESWRFAADEGWQAVGAVADVQPAEFTEAGLPKRQPRALLLPGSAPRSETTQSQTVPSGTARSESPATGVPAERLRHRLSGFQHGVQRARHEQADGQPGREDTEQVTAEVAVRAAPVAEPDRWASLADDGWRAAAEVVGDPPATESTETTAAGLPRRQPRAHLLPGSVAPPAERHAVPARDAGVLRDRLSSFQRGVREGRSGAEPVGPAVPATPAEHGFDW